MDGWMGGWIGGWMGGWVDGWMERGRERDIYNIISDSSLDADAYTLIASLLSEHKVDNPRINISGGIIPKG